MKHMKVAQARARFGEVLDDAENGSPVVIERRGVRFRVTVDAPRNAPEAPPPLFERIDADVLEGQWTWQSGPSGLAFTTRRRKRR